MGKLVMGYWDCPVCGTKEIRGDVVSCPSCGRARGDVQFYLKGYDENAVVSVQEAESFNALSEEEAEIIGDRPDWYCSFCNSLNNDKFQVCQTCGASRTDSEANYFQMLEKKKEKEAAETAAQPQVSAEKKKSSRLFILLAVVVLAVVGLFLWMNGRKTADWEVTALSWERNIQIEEYRQIDESSWSLPANAELVSKRKEIRTYTSQFVGYKTEEYTESVYDHDEVVGYDQVDRGNGSIELVPRTRPVYRSERRTREVPQYINVPVYDFKYYYKIWRWSPSRVASASDSNHTPFWPELNLSENEREAENNGRTEIYRFAARGIKEPDKTVLYRLNEADWMNIEVGDQIHISVKNSGGGAYLCDESGNKIADLTPDK